MTIQEELSTIEKRKLLESLTSYKTQATNAVNQLKNIKLNIDAFKTMVQSSPLFSADEETEISAIIDAKITEIKTEIESI